MASSLLLRAGACRHGDRCSRLHNRPTISPTLLMQNMYQNPALNAPPGADGLPIPVDPRKSQEHFEVCAVVSVRRGGSMPAVKPAAYLRGMWAPCMPSVNLQTWTRSAVSIRSWFRLCWAGKSQSLCPNLSDALSDLVWQDSD